MSVEESATEPMRVVHQLHENGIIAVIRAPNVTAAVRAVDTLVDGGVTTIEITYSTPDVPQVLRRITASHGGGVLLGVGTITQPDEVWAAAEAGARFLVSPGVDEAVAAAMTSTGLASLFGAFTPTEVMQALSLGAHAVKLFPASTGGIGHLRALRGPFPDVRLVPTGGVSVDNLPDWLAAGAYAVGAAGSLCPPDALAAGDYREIGRRAVAFSGALQRFRGRQTVVEEDDQ